MYLLISLCYFTAKGQIAGTQHYRNRHIRSRYDNQAGIKYIALYVQRLSDGKTETETDKFA